MKTLSAVITAIALCLALTGCQKTVPAAASSDPAPAVSVHPSESHHSTTYTQPIHTHNWLVASCTDPEVCSHCGQIQGEPLGHNWAAATCSGAAVCTVCGATDGEPTAHAYSNGACIHCGAVDPATETQVWIPTNGGTKYHSSADCSNMKDPLQIPLSEAEARGFTPCKRCH